MRILILGAGGMLGHKLVQQLAGDGTVVAAFRDAAPYRALEPFRRAEIIDGIDAYDLSTIESAIQSSKPDVVINCIGIVKQLAEANDPIACLTINSLFPHRLLQLGRAAGARVIHISTDCVFSGSKGMYTEDDVSDAEDLYGRTKYLGEIAEPPGLTLRTSIIGREIRTKTGLVEWFLANDGGTVRGFTKAIYSGFTTLALARVIRLVITTCPDLTGLFHVSSEPIDKYHLLQLVHDAYGLSIRVTPDASIAIDRSLNSDRFRQRTGFQPPAWPEMIAEMAADTTPYVHWRSRQ